MSALVKVERLPDWPARMTAPVAAAYMGIGTTAFLTRYGSMGIKEGGNTLWARAQLDSAIAKQFRLAQPSAPAGERDDSWDDLR